MKTQHQTALIGLAYGETHSPHRTALESLANKPYI